MLFGVYLGATNPGIRTGPDPLYVTIFYCMEV